MVRTDEHLVDVEECTVRIVLADGNIIPATKNGTLSVATGEGTMVLSQVLVAPRLEHALLSVRALAQQDVTVTFDKDRVQIEKDGSVLAVGSGKSREYKIRLKVDTSAAETASSARDDMMVAWHVRLGHPGRERLKAALKQLGLEGECKNIATFDCSSCHKGKQVRAVFKPSKHRENVAGGLLHLDLCGPIKGESISGVRYFLTIVDDATGYLQASLLADKTAAAVAEAFEHYCAWFERQNDVRIKKIRTDGGTEFVEVVNNADRKGIVHQKSVRYTPQQNGAAERANRTIVEIVRCLMQDANIPRRLWPEVVSTAVHLYNRVPGGDGKTPKQRLEQRETPHDLSYLRRIGCRAYTKIPGELNSKLESRSRVGFLIGYGLRTKSWRVYDAEKREVFECRDVLFDESIVFPECEKVDGFFVLSSAVSNAATATDGSATASVEKARTPVYSGERRVARILDERKRGRGTQYFVEWSDKNLEPSWEPARLLAECVALDDWEARDVERARLQVQRKNDGSYHLGIAQYIEKLAAKFNPGHRKTHLPIDANTVIESSDECEESVKDEFSAIIGSLMFAATTARPDIMCVTSLLSRHLAKPSACHLNAAKRVLRFLITTKDRGLLFPANNEALLQAWCDSDWAGDRQTRKSTTGGAIMFGKSLVGWRSVRQTCTAKSSVEAELVAASDIASLIIWFRNLLEGIGLEQDGPTRLGIDSVGAQRLAESGQPSRRTKHIEVDHFYVHDLLMDKKLYLEHENTKDNPSDIFTKGLGRELFEKHSATMNIVIAGTVTRRSMVMTRLQERNAQAAQDVQAGQEVPQATEPQASRPAGVAPDSNLAQRVATMSAQLEQMQELIGSLLTRNSELSRGPRTVAPTDNAVSKAVHDNIKSFTGGTVAQLNEFCVLMDICFKNSAKTSEEQFALAVCKLSDHALMWYQEHLQQNPPGSTDEITTWVQLRAALYKRFSKPLAELDVLGSLRRLRQGGRLVIQYNSDFAKLTAQAPGMRETEKIRYYLDGLDSEIHKMVVSHAGNLESVDAAKAAAIRQDSPHFQERTETAQYANGRRGFGNGGALKKNRKKNPKKVRCFNCEKVGHFASECTAEAKRKPRGK
ncbi:UNVERIFIED_CONTAM: hypothetical protein B566_EDAN019055, partial [Ephemera danica]